MCTLKTTRHHVNQVHHQRSQLSQSTQTRSQHTRRREPTWRQGCKEAPQRTDTIWSNLVAIRSGHQRHCMTRRGTSTQSHCITFNIASRGGFISDTPAWLDLEKTDRGLCLFKAVHTAISCAVEWSLQYAGHLTCIAQQRAHPQRCQTASSFRHTPQALPAAPAQPPPLPLSQLQPRSSRTAKGPLRGARASRPAPAVLQEKSARLGKQFWLTCGFGTV